MMKYDYRTTCLLLLFLIQFAGMSFAQNCSDQSACNYDPSATGIEDCCYGFCVEMTLYDAYGDGWNGNSLTISSLTSGEVAFTGTLDHAQGGDQLSIGYYSFCLDGDDCYSITVDGGAFVNEVFWHFNTQGGPTMIGYENGVYEFCLGENDKDFCFDENACNYSPLYSFPLQEENCCYTSCIKISADAMSEINGTDNVELRNENDVVLSSWDLTEENDPFETRVCLSDGCYHLVLDNSNNSFYYKQVSKVSSYLDNQMTLIQENNANLLIFGVGTSSCGQAQDFDGDGLVGITDLMGFLGQIGCTGMDCQPYDLNGDGIVNLADLLLLLNQYG